MLGSSIIYDHLIENDIINIDQNNVSIVLCAYSVITLN